VDPPDSYRISVHGSTQVPDGRCLVFVYGTVTLFGWLSHTILLTKHFVTSQCQALQPHYGKPQWFGLFPFRSPLLREYSLFLRVLRCFSSPGAPRSVYVFNGRYQRFALVGFPIRKSPDISPVYGSPKLIAITYVLHRHLAPRHPP